MKALLIMQYTESLLDAWPGYAVKLRFDLVEKGVLRWFYAVSTAPNALVAHVVLMSANMHLE